MIRAELRALRGGDRWWLLAGVVVGGALGSLGALGVSGVGSAGTPLARTLALIGFASYGGWSAWLTLSDLRTRRLPNATVWWASCSVIGVFASALLVGGAGDTLRRALAVSAVAAVCAAATWFVWPGLFGAGDVKLVPLTVFVAALPDSSLAILIFIAGVVCASAILAVVTLVRRRAVFAFGPVLLLASWCAVGVGPAVIHTRW